MNVYDVTIRYNVNDTATGTTTIGATIKIRKKASNPGMAAAIATQVFTMLGNFKDNDLLWFDIDNVSVSLVNIPEPSEGE